MALWDDIQAVAQSKSTYNPQLTRVKRADVSRAASTRRVASPYLRAPKPRFGPEVVLPTVKLPDLPGRPAAGGSDIWDFVGRVPDSPAEQEDSGGGNWKSKIGNVFGDIIDVVDTPRAFAVSAASELGNALPGAGGGRQDFSWSDVMDDTWRNKGFGEVIEEEFPDAPRAVKLAGGLIGDVALDPTTYLTAGTVKAATGAARAGRATTALDNALLSGGRRELSEQVVLQAAKSDIAKEAADRLAREAGTRGRGAFTRKGLARAGVSAEDAAKLGREVDFGYRVRVGRRGVNVPLTRTLAETSENLKGNIKKFTGGHRASELWRSAKITSNFGEKALVREVFQGTANAPDAARALAAIKLAKADSWTWLDQTVADASRQMPELSKMKPDDLAEITHAIERGEFVGLSAKVKEFYDSVGAYLKSEGVDFEWRDMYVNHTLSKKALRDLRNGDHRLKAMGLSAEEAFQQTRALEGTIAEINARHFDELGYNLLEDDVAVLMGRYMTQAQRALMRAKVSQKLGPDQLGVARPLTEIVDEKAKKKAVKGAQSELDEATEQEALWLQKANKERRQNLTKATRVVTERRRETALELQQAEQTLDAAVKRLRDSERALTAAEGRLAGLEVAERQWNAVAKRGRTGSKSAASRKLRQIQRDRANLTGKIRRLRTQIDGMAGKKGVVQLRADKAVLERQHGEIAMQARELAEARKALDETPLGAGASQGEAELADTVERIRKVRQAFIDGVGEHIDAANAFVWIKADVDTATSRLNAALARFDEATEAIIDAPKIGNKALDDVEYRRMVRDELRERTQTVQKVLATRPDDPRVKALANIEGQAAGHDMEALQWRMSAKEIQAQINALKDPKFIDHMMRVTDDGFTALGDELQMPKWLDDAFDQRNRLRNYEDVTGLVRMMDSFNNWWKGWATASPGFVVRNWYSGVFNIWLDRGPGALKSMTEFRQFYKRYEKNADEAFAWAERKFGPEGRAQFEQSLQAAAASGWGLTPQEVSTQLIGEQRSKLNLFSSKHILPGKIRDVSSNVEAILRGSHAYDIIKSGGDVTTAISRVEKYHFNYRDISDFDRAAKKIVPFWTFFSRNMALQANVWTHAPAKLNRSYFNVKRNLELQAGEDDTVPAYFGDIGAIRTPFGEPNGGKWYLTPDLPSLRFREDLVGSLGLDDEGGFDPLRVVSDFGPLVKTPIEMIQNRQLFTGIPFKNRLHDYDENGNPIVRNAPVWGQIPGVSQALDMLPGTQMVGGDLAMQDNTQHAIEGLWPLMGRATRLLPNQPKYQERQGQSVASFLGAPIRQNTEGSIQGELYRQQLVSEKQRLDAARQQMLRELGGG